MQEKVREPVSPGKIAKVPVIMQMDALECGAVCLNMVLSYYGRYVSASRLRKECGVSRDGSSYKSMKIAAESYGLVAAAFELDTEHIKTGARFPAVLLWENKHFVVLRGYRNGTFVINDPAYGEVKLHEERFNESYSGIAMIFIPGPDFVPGGERENISGFIKKKLKGTGQLSAMILITSVILTISGIISPLFSRFFIDYLLPGNVSAAWRPVFFRGFIFLLATRLTVLLIRSIYMLRIKGKISLYSSTSFVWRVLRLPADFFSQRYTADIIGRIGSNDLISARLVETFIPAVLNFASLVFYLGMMLSYSPLMALIGVISVFLNIAVSSAGAGKVRNLARVKQKNRTELSNWEAASVKMLETIKASGAEDYVFENWSGLYAQVSHDAADYREKSVVTGSIPQCLSFFTESLILCMGVGACIKGDWTIGLVSAFNAYLVSFMEPSRELAGFSLSFQWLRLQMEKIADVDNYDTCAGDVSVQYPDEELPFLSGEIDIDNVTFGYNRASDPVIKDFSLHVEPGQSIAFVGGSGCGKSTLAKLILGLYDPWSGKISFDGKTAAQAGRAVFSASVGSVDQTISLFPDTVYNNITMWDRGITYEAAAQAAKDACIYEDIIKCEKGFDTDLLENGKNFSGGQRQRIEIARALAAGPKILVLDEATSSLDAETEGKIISAVKKKKMTKIIISHRLSTVRDCDKIIVFKEGKELDRGTHSELMERCGYYKEMITNE